MEIREERVKEGYAIELIGRLDATSAPQLEERLSKLLADGKTSFLMDLEELDYISSVGLRVLLALAKKAKSAEGQVILCCLQEHIQEVFEIAGFTVIFPIYSTRNGCISALAQ